MTITPELDELTIKVCMGDHSWSILVILPMTMTINSNSVLLMCVVGGNMHKAGLNAGDTQSLHKCLGRNSVLVDMSCVNMKPLHLIKSRANVDGWSVSQTFSTAQESSHHILKSLEC